MAWNTEDFAARLHRACRSDPANAPPARPEPIPRVALASMIGPLRRRMVRRARFASVNSGFGLVALLIVGGAIWLFQPQALPGQAPGRKAVSLAVPVPSQVAGQLALPLLRRPAEQPPAMTAPNSAPEAPPPVAGETKPIDPRNAPGVFEPGRPHQPPPASSVVLATQTAPSESVVPSGPTSSVA